MANVRAFGNVSLAEKSKIFESVIDIYDIAEDVVGAVDDIENPILKNHYVSAIDGLIGPLDESLRIISEEYSNIAKSGKVTKSASKKIAKAIADINDAVSVAKDALSGS